MASSVRFSISRSGDRDFKSCPGFSVEKELDFFQLHQETTYEGETVETTFDLGYINSGKITWDDLFQEFNSADVICEHIVSRWKYEEKRLEYSIVVSRKKGQTTYIFKCESQLFGTIYRISIPISNPADSFTYELQKLIF